MAPGVGLFDLRLTPAPVDPRKQPFERQILGDADVLGNRSRYGVDRTAARGRYDQNVWFVRERRKGRANQEAKIMIGHRALRDEDDLCAFHRDHLPKTGREPGR